MLALPGPEFRECGRPIPNQWARWPWALLPELRLREVGTGKRPETEAEVEARLLDEENPPEATPPQQSHEVRW